MNSAPSPIDRPGVPGAFTRRALLGRTLIGGLGLAASTSSLILPGTTTAAYAATGALPPRAPSVMAGYMMPPVPYTMQPLYDLENAMNAGQAVTAGAEIIMYGHPWATATDPVSGAPTRFAGFAWNYMDAIYRHGSYPCVGWQPWDASHQSSAGPNTPAWRTSEITRGTYDAYIRQFARDCRTWGHAMFLRPAHEMNGPWRFPWCEPNNGNRPGDYARMFRHLHDIFDQEGVTNVTWVFNPNIISNNSIPIAGLYPGDAYVDWTALDGYNWGTDYGNVWQTFRQVYSSENTTYGTISSYQELLNIAPTKPIMLCEVASSTRGGPNGTASAGIWYQDMLEVQIPNNYPMIRAIIHQNDNYGDPARCSWPITTTSEGMAAWKHGMHFREGIGGNFYGHNGHFWLPRADGAGGPSNGKIRPGTYQPLA